MDKVSFSVGVDARSKPKLIVLIIFFLAMLNQSLHGEVIVMCITIAAMLALFGKIIYVKENEVKFKYIGYFSKD